MRDYKKYAQDLRRIAQFQNCFECYEGERTEGSCSSRCTFNKAADAIEELLDVVPRWISVEERLPDNGADVLCWYEYYHYSKDEVLPEYGIGYCFNGQWGGEVSNGRNCKVLYWMPLPAPPKGVE